MTLTEDDLRRYLGNSGKLVDFLLVDGQSNVFMDAKGVQLGYLGMVSHRRDVVLDKIRSSVVKAISQAYEVARNLSSIEALGEFRIGTGANYLLVVTYEDFFVGNGRDLYHNVAKRELDEIVELYGGKQWVPFENMYFLSIDDLDLLVGCVAIKKMGLAEMLEKAVAEDRDPETSKFAFWQHVFEACPDSPIPILLEK